MPGNIRTNRIFRFAGLFLLALGVVSCSKSTHRERVDRFPNIPDWPRFGGDVQDRHTSSSSLAPPLHLVWEDKVSAAVGQSMIVVDGTLYLATMDGSIYAFDVLTGNRVWREKTKNRIAATSIYARGSLVVAIRFGTTTLRRFDLAKRKDLWRAKAGSIETEPLVVDDEVYVATLYGQLMAYDFSTGTQRWSFEAEGQLHSSPALADSLIVFGSDKGYVYAVRRSAGTLAWRFEADEAILAAPSVATGRVFVGSRGGTFYALNAASGDKEWQFDAGGAVVHAAASDNERVVFGTARHKMYALAAEGGMQLWTFEAGSVIGTSPLVTPNLVYFGSLDHHYYALDLETGRAVWRYETKGRVRTDPVIWNDRLFGASEDNWVYSFMHGEPAPESAGEEPSSDGSQ